MIRSVEDRPRETTGDQMAAELQFAYVTDPSRPDEVTWFAFVKTPTGEFTGSGATRVEAVNDAFRQALPGVDIHWTDEALSSRAVTGPLEPIASAPAGEA